jgi:alcohol dehydrogenase class IV
MTPVYGLTEAGVKRTGRDARVLPRCVIYDPELWLGLPFGIAVVSAINAIAHAAEGLDAPDTNPVIDALAAQGINAWANALTRLQRNSRDLETRGDALVGAWLCGTVMGSITVGLHHKPRHTLGGSFDLPHAETHAVVLSHAMAWIRRVRGKRCARFVGMNAGRNHRQRHLPKLSNSICQLGPRPHGISAEYRVLATNFSERTSIRFSIARSSNEQDHRLVRCNGLRSACRLRGVNASGVSDSIVRRAAVSRSTRRVARWRLRGQPRLRRARSKIR